MNTGSRDIQGTDVAEGMAGGEALTEQGLKMTSPCLFTWVTSVSPGIQQLALGGPLGPHRQSELREIRGQMLPENFKSTVPS